jgi:hypothetical protein
MRDYFALVELIKPSQTYSNIKSMNPFAFSCSQSSLGIRPGLGELAIVPGSRQSCSISRSQSGRTRGMLNTVYGDWHLSPCFVIHALFISIREGAQCQFIQDSKADSNRHVEQG